MMKSQDRWVVLVYRIEKPMSEDLTIFGPFENDDRARAFCNLNEHLYKDDKKEYAFWMRRIIHPNDIDKHIEEEAHRRLKWWMMDIDRNFSKRRKERKDYPWSYQGDYENGISARDSVVRAIEYRIKHGPPIKKKERQ